MIKKSARAWWVTVMAALLITPAVISLQGCTDLDEQTFGVVTPDNFFQTDEEVLAAVAPVYAQLRQMLWNYHNLSQHSSDETLVPTRGTDWDDGGRWRSMHKHTWDKNLTDLNGAWTDAFTGVARANTVIDAIENATATVSNKDQLIAELRFLRAFYYFQLLDFFGNVPIVTVAAVDPDNPPGNDARADVYNFVVSELEAAKTALPARWDSGNYGRATTGAANALLSRLYLNAEILSGTTTAGGIQKGAAAWQQAIDASNAVINAGLYNLEDDYLDNFRANNNNSPELIFVTPTLASEPRLGIDFIMRSLHYNMIPETPWNGFIVLADVYRSFDPDDRRADIFLAGQMYEEPSEGCIGSECFRTGDMILDRQNNPLVFTPDLFAPDGTPITAEPVGVSEGSGVRVVKWEIDPSRAGRENGNDYAWFRLAEMYLNRAEANLWLGNTGAALADLNVLRDRAFGNDATKRLTTVDVPTLLAERQYELLWEAVRRMDMIRHDLFTTTTWEFKTATEPHRAVFPIPQAQIDANPNLVQNPGY